MFLNELKDNDGARKKRMRVGRGIGSGKGKTSGRGVKGQKSRTGVSINGFEGGQNPLFRRLPKRGFNNSNFRRQIAAINLGQLQAAVDAGRLPTDALITYDVLVQCGLVKSRAEGVKLLGSGELNTPLNLEVLMASKSAVEAFSKSKGSLKVIEQ